MIRRGFVFLGVAVIFLSLNLDLNLTTPAQARVMEDPDPTGGSSEPVMPPASPPWSPPAAWDLLDYPVEPQDVAYVPEGLRHCVTTVPSLPLSQVRQDIAELLHNVELEDLGEVKSIKSISGIEIYRILAKDNPAQAYEATYYKNNLMQIKVVNSESNEEYTFYYRYLPVKPALLPMSNEAGEMFYRCTVAETFTYNDLSGRPLFTVEHTIGNPAVDIRFKDGKLWWRFGAAMLIQQLKNPEDAVAQKAAVAGLSALKDKTAIKPLREVLVKTTDYALRFQIQNAISNIEYNSDRP